MLDTAYSTVKLFARCSLGARVQGWQRAPRWDSEMPRMWAIDYDKTHFCSLRRENLARKASNHTALLSPKNSSDRRLNTASTSNTFQQAS
jgi:hypothetical protein